MRKPAGSIVVDLSALWAGPLCGDLLAGTGATVIKVESPDRPDGARRGPAAFFDLLNGRKRSVALDFRTAEGATALHALLGRADVVIEASRPRALEQLGVHAAEVVRGGGPQVWVSITGYGRTDASSRVAFGDDAAAGGGLVVSNEGAPMFCADAVADPITGLTAANACLDALASGGRWLLDVSMAGVCAGLAGPTLPTPLDIPVAPPRARRAARAAAALGADTAAVMAELGL
jgi:crotonobetainyl-CoA:carnitine CoA-transferase CaiB-like acyl-CoA transferase